MRRAIAGMAVIVTVGSVSGCRTVAEASGAWRPARRGGPRPDGRSGAAHGGWQA